MSKKIAILQSNYIPWKGYFDLMNSVDEFVIYDEMQYTRRDWRNRNKIKTQNGLLWLTIPVKVKGKFYQKINDTKINDPSWTQKHWKAIKLNYSKAKFFEEYADVFEKLYGENESEKYLSKVNYNFLSTINSILGIKTKLTFSKDLNIIEGKTERLVDICKQLDASEYLSGPSAKDYIVDKLFQDEGIKLLYMDYSGYKEYNQLYPPFEHGVSVLDLIFNEGPNARNFMKS